ncbi:hypothetical protein GCM10023324_31640 [Streptomyces youssoufiensis]
MVARWTAADAAGSRARRWGGATSATGAQTRAGARAGTIGTVRAAATRPAAWSPGPGPLPTGTPAAQASGAARG